eukprot:Skav234592  [mRNA]  locus=scaffold313:536369:542802:- [translate_table: standard]
MELVALLFGIPTDWANAKTLISESNFGKRFRAFKKEASRKEEEVQAINERLKVLEDTVDVGRVGAGSEEGGDGIRTMGPSAMKEMWNVIVEEHQEKKQQHGVADRVMNSEGRGTDRVFHGHRRLPHDLQGRLRSLRGRDHLHESTAAFAAKPATGPVGQRLPGAARREEEQLEFGELVISLVDWSS